MDAEWIVFFNKKTDKELVKISVEGCFPGEIKSTKGLLAYENNISEDDIKVKIQ